VRCHACRSPHRLSAELLVVTGVGYTRTVRALPADPGMTPKSLREHILRGHAAGLQAVARSAIACASGKPENVLARGIEATIVQLAEAVEVVQATDRLLESGRLRPTLGQALKATKLLISLEAIVRAERCLEERLEESHALTARALRLVRGTVPSEVWSDVLRAVECDRDLRLFVGLKEAA
jgi:hypothetical protein